MKTSQSTLKSLKNVHFLLEEAKNAEFRRDIIVLQKILNEIWNEADGLPTFEEYEPPVRAELFRLCGFYITFYTRTFGLRDKQINAKDLLTRAIDIFTEEDLPEKAAESNILLAFSFWNAGEVTEAEDILNLVEYEFSGDQKHPIYLQLQINRLMIASWSDELEKAGEYIDTINKLIVFSNDFRLKTLFHIEAGITSRKLKDYIGADYHFSEVSRLSKKHLNRHCEAHNLNNFANLYRQQNQFTKAHNSIREAIEIVKQLDQSGCIAHFLDTRANIYLDEGKNSRALKTIEEALSISSRGENYLRLTEHLWTKCQCLFALEQPVDAFIVYGEIQTIAHEKISDKIVKRYARLLANRTYALQNESLDREVDRFEKSLIKKALIKSEGGICKASQLLGFENHKGLSWKINHKYSELYEELNITKKSRTDKGQKAPKKQHMPGTKVSEIKREKNISRLITATQDYSFNFDFEGETVETFYFDSEVMKDFGVSGGAIVAVVPITTLRAGLTAIIYENNKFLLGKIETDDFSGISYIIDTNSEWIPIDQNNLIGRPVGYSSLNRESFQQAIRFEKLRLDF